MMADSGSKDLTSVCYGYIGQLRKKTKELEELLLDYENRDQVLLKNARLLDTYKMFQGKVSECIISTEKVEPVFENAASDHHEFQKHVCDWLQVAEDFMEKKLSHSGDDKVDVISASKHNGDDDMCSGHQQHQEASSSDRQEASTSDRHGDNVYGGGQRYQGNASSTSCHGDDLDPSHPRVHGYTSSAASIRHGDDLDLSHRRGHVHTSSLNGRGDDLDLGRQRESSSRRGDDLDLGHQREYSSDRRGASDRQSDLDLSHQNQQSRTSRQELTLIKGQRSTDTHDVLPDGGQRSTSPPSTWDLPFKKGQGSPGVQAWDLPLKKSEPRHSVKDGGASVHSGSSHTSTSSTRLLKAKMKLQLAQLKAEQLASQLRLEREKVVMEEKLAMMKVKNELEQANLECTYLESVDNNSDKKSVTEIPCGKPIVLTKCDKQHESNISQGHIQGQRPSTGVSHMQDNGVVPQDHSLGWGSNAGMQHDGTMFQGQSQGQRSYVGVNHVQENPKSSQGQSQGQRPHTGVTGATHVQENPMSSQGCCQGQTSFNDVREMCDDSERFQGYNQGHPSTSYSNVGNVGDSQLPSVLNAMLLNLNMPKQEINMFDGNPADYWTFMHNFVVNVESKLTDNNTKLTYLLQFCKGRAKQSIENCVLLGEYGYDEARRILKTQYGHPHIVAHTLLNKVCSRRQIRNNDPEALWDLARDMQKCLITLGHIGAHTSTDQLLQIQRILPVRLQGDWAKRARSVMQIGREPTFEDMAKFIQDAALTGSTMFGRNIGQTPSSDKSNVKSNVSNRVVSYSSQTYQQQRQFVTNKPQQFRAQVNQSQSSVTSQDISTSACVCCGKKHKLEECYNFKEMSKDDRRQLFRDKRLCDNCLRPFHYSRGCMMKPACTIEGCGRRHHTLLHTNEQQKDLSITVPKSVVNSIVAEPPQLILPINGDSGDTSTGKIVGTTGSNRSGVYLRVLPVKVRGNNYEVETLALLDSGSQISLCSKKLANRIGLKGEQRPLRMTTVNGTNMITGIETDISVGPANGDDSIDMRVTAVEKMPISSSLPSSTEITKWSHLRDVEFCQPSTDNTEVLLLIGADVPEVFWVLDERRGGKRQPFAIKSVLGWTLMGPADAHERNDVSVGCVLTCDLMDQVKKFWETDFGGSLVESRADVAESVEDKRARSIMEGSVKLVDGHYKMDLPWRFSKPYLPHNKLLAEARLRILKRKLQKDEGLFVKYRDAINDYLIKDFARLVPQDETGNQRDLRWYLPHHAVFHPHKPGKVRVVFDCSAQHGGTSLNDQLLKGPDFLNSIVAVLTRFREEKVAIVADVEGMFNQVRVSEKDCDALGFLWWPDDDFNKEPVKYQMLVHLFGATSSPSCASFALRKAATDNASEFDQKTVDTVLQDFYVDDCLQSVPTIPGAQRLSKQLIDILAKGGFKLTKWLSNERDVIASIPEDKRAGSMKDMDLDKLPLERTLGVHWNVESDAFEFHVTIREKEETRRGILSMISSLYDPLGFLAPFILLAKILLQELCRKGKEWDEPVSEEDVSKWRNWLKDLPRLSEVSIPRCFRPDNVVIGTFELHNFSDASTSAYSAVTYLRMTDSEGVIHCAFVIGKSRLSPLKAITIPRLELSAAVLAVKLCQQVKAELRIPIADVIYWTDSTSVIQYLYNESRRFCTFVANRIAQIQSVSKPSQWHYVNTEQNPADDGSRGLKVDEFIKRDRWLKGPEFLKKHPSDWPTPPAILADTSDYIRALDADPEVKLVTFSATDIPHQGLLDGFMEAFSSWNKLRRAVGWILRYKNFLLRTIRASSDLAALKRSTLTVEELKESERQIIKFVQSKSFPEEIKLLKTAIQLKNVPKMTNRMRKLSPDLINDVLHVGGRLENAPIKDDIKHPIILPTNHHVTQLLINHHHEVTGHCGAGATWSSLRQRYWVLKGGAAVRRVIGNCFDCKRRNAPLGEQIMAELPVARVSPDNPPFTNTGVDYFGPITVKQARSHVKRYGCLFTCLAVRAVHIEVAHKLDTDSFLNALRRFMNRRGTPQCIYSDNGSNFIGGERELREALQNINQKKVNDYLIQKEIEWHFSPPLASHMGGVWERMVKSVKTILKVLLKDQVVEDEVLATLMTEVEAILNSRPITQISQDSKDEEPLTPNHLLLLRPLSSLPPGVFDRSDSYGIRRWRQAQYLADQFWKRWLKDYLPMLQLRQKWTQPRRNLMVGDLVLVLDENAPRSKWPLARVTQVYPDRFGWVRQVDVRIGTKIIKRPIAKLCFLESTS